MRRGRRHRLASLAAEAAAEAGPLERLPETALVKRRPPVEGAVAEDVVAAAAAAAAANKPVLLRAAL